MHSTPDTSDPLNLQRNIERDFVRPAEQPDETGRRAAAVPRSRTFSEPDPAYEGQEWDSNGLTRDPRHRWPRFNIIDIQRDLGSIPTQMAQTLETRRSVKTGVCELYILGRCTESTCKYRHPPIETLRKCPVCWYPYRDINNCRRMVYPKCGHAICHLCKQKIHQADRANHQESACPQCRREGTPSEVAIPRYDIEHE
jgi:hypothetical protein